MIAKKMSETGAQPPAGTRPVVDIMQASKRASQWLASPPQQGRLFGDN